MFSSDWLPAVRVLTSMTPGWDFYPSFFHLPIHSIVYTISMKVLSGQCNPMVFNSKSTRVFLRIKTAYWCLEGQVASPNLLSMEWFHFSGKAAKILSHSQSLLCPSSYSVHLHPWLPDLGLSLHLATVLLLVGCLISQISSKSLEERNQWEGSGRGYAKLPKWLLWRAWRGRVMLLWHRELGFDSGQWRKCLSH